VSTKEIDISFRFKAVQSACFVQFINTLKTRFQACFFVPQYYKMFS